MNPRETWGGRLVLWWVDRYTRSAPEPDGRDRSAEIHADLFEQLAHARGRQDTSRAVAARALRGLHHDLLWRATVERRPGRLQWHLEHPASLLGVLFLLLVPAAVVVDGARGRSGSWGTVSLVIGPALVLLCATTIGFASTAAVHVTRRRPRLRPLRADGVRRAALAAMSVSWAVAAVWRFAPGLSGISSVAWAGFGVSLVGYLAAVTMGGLSRRRPVDNGKVPS